MSSCKGNYINLILENSGLICHMRYIYTGMEKNLTLLRIYVCNVIKQHFQ